MLYSSALPTKSGRLVCIIQQIVQELHIDGMEQVEKHQSQGGFRRAKRLALITGIASLSLLGVGFVLQPSLTGGKLREYTREISSKSSGRLTTKPQRA